MTVVHAGATLGAITGPLLVELLAANHHWSASFRLTGLAHLAIAAAAFGLRFPGPPTPDRTSDAASAGVFRVLRSRSLLPFALVAFAYVGIEGAATIFALPYAGDAGGLSEARGRATISALWSGLLVGRLAAAPLVGRHGPRVLLAAGPLAAACLCVGVLAGAHHAAATFAAVGLALGGVFPVMISLAAQQFPDAPGTAAGLAAGAGALGGAAIPWITGLIGDGVSVTAAVGSLALWCAAIAAGAAAITRLPAPRPAARR